MKKIIGVIGPTGSGKSTFCAFLKELSVFIIDADKIGKDILKPGTAALKKVSDIFGSDILLPNGGLNRKKLGSIVFADSAMLDKLNSVTKEPIENEIIRQINLISDGIICIDCALLLQTKIKYLCDKIVFISSTFDNKASRILKRDGLTVKDTHNRILAQKDDFKSEADIIIENNKDLDFLKKQAEELYKKLNS